MSHLKERHEKTCLNCQTALYGRYCHQCGQENLEPKETVWHLIQHFFNDITHFDGKFFSTGKYLLFKPGFLSAEYMAGRRASYLNPIRMYVFTSAIFFLILFTLKKPKDMINEGGEDAPVKVAKSFTELRLQKEALERDLAAAADEDDKRSDRKRIDRLAAQLAGIKMVYGDTTTRRFTKEELTRLSNRVAAADSVRKAADSARKVAANTPKSGDNMRKSVDSEAKNGDTAGKGGSYRYGGPVGAKAGVTKLEAAKPAASEAVSPAGGAPDHAGAGKRQDPAVKKDAGEQNDILTNFGDNKEKFESEKAYDSVEQSLPDSLRDGWFIRIINKRMITVREEWHKDRRGYVEHLLENFLHSFPKIMFFSLPFFALILNVLYARRKKTYYYVDHGIFTIHLYCATFILTLAGLLLSRLSGAIDQLWFSVIDSVVGIFLFIYVFIYLYKAMRVFYKQGRGKTILKYLLLCFFSFIVNLILLMIFLLISAVSV